MGFFNWLFGRKSSDGENKELLSEANATIDQLKQELAMARQSQGDYGESRNKEVEAKYK